MPTMSAPRKWPRHLRCRLSTRGSVGIGAFFFATGLARRGYRLMWFCRSTSAPPTGYRTVIRLNSRSSSSPNSPSSERANTLDRWSLRSTGPGTLLVGSGTRLSRCEGYGPIGASL